MTRNGRFAALTVALVVTVAAPVGAAPEMAARIDAALRKGGLRGARVGIAIADLATGETIYERDADALLIPASVNKVVTAAAALKLLTPQYKFRSGLFGRGARRGNTWQGDVYLKVWGDPALVAERVWVLVRELRIERGIEEISGSLIVDDHFFDPVRFGHDWGPRSRRWYHAPHGAVSVNFNTETIRGAYRAIAEDPSLYAGRFFADMMREVGIELRGSVVTGGALPDDAVELVSAESKPLHAIIDDLNKISNNFIAEQILKTLGAERREPPGTAAKGIAVIGDYLLELGLAEGSYRIHDGSGLSRSNRLSARAVVRLLDSVARDFEIGPELIASLKVAGIEGSKSRFQDPLCKRQMRVKTGHLYAVAALAGFAETAAGRRLVFAIIANDYRRGRWAADAAIEEICEAFLAAGPPAADAPGGAAAAALDPTLHPPIAGPDGARAEAQAGD